MEKQIKEQAKLQSPRVEKILKEKGKENMGESTGHRNQMILENSSTSIEHQSNSSNHESSNPLLSMLTNLGMNVGGIDVSPNVSAGGPITQQNAFTEVTTEWSMKNLLPNGANVISAEELENQLRSIGPSNERIPARMQAFPT